MLCRKVQNEVFQFREFCSIDPGGRQTERLRKCFCFINAGIFDGDLAIIEECKTANNGEIVVALIENEATIKRFYKEKNHIRLQPENDNMDAIIVDNCTILGKLVGLFRTY